MQQLNSKSQGDENGKFHCPGFGMQIRASKNQAKSPAFYEV